LDPETVISQPLDQETAMNPAADRSILRRLVVPTVSSTFILAAAFSTVAAPPTNFDEAAVGHYTLPDPLVAEDGSKITTVEQWRTRRRPELLQLFSNEVYGRTPVDRPKELAFVVREEKSDARDGKATRLRVGVLFEGREDGRQMELLVYIPNHVKGKAPLMYGLNFDGNYSTTLEKDIPVPTHWINGGRLNRPRNDHRPFEEARGFLREQWQYDLALERGYAVATAAYGEIEPDADGHRDAGPRGMGPPPDDSEWGAIGAWAWALSRGLDYLENHPRIDARRVAVLGFSRLGKTSLWAGAQDERFSAVISLQSGAGGAALSKRNYGETVQDLNRRFPHWFCGNFRKYSDNESALPVDQHQLISLIAPRPVLIISATEDRWADPRGEFLSGLAADPVYKLHGVDGVGETEWPGPNQLMNSRIGYFMREGPHDVTKAEWHAMVDFLDKHLPAKE
jgi:hypothetical protein